ncbi:MAG: metallophosphoesterase [Phycisphaerales bacterium]|nr:MAG: metallophosphoesterase [Phycisphaerales bacterium]
MGASRLVALAWVAAAMLLAACGGCGGIVGAPLPNEATEHVDTGRFELLTRFVHLSDAHILDEESPGRLVATASFAPYFGAHAWRPQEAYSTQVLDGTIRMVNKMHVARHSIDFVLHTGDATDNAQLNELEWFVGVFDGGMIDPRSGPDDRVEDELSDPLLDPHHPFEAQGLYRRGVHGDAATIPWYSLLGNHDRFASGTFPIVADLFSRRTSPLPLLDRFGIFLPRKLDPTGSLSWAPITPANPGPPAELNFPAIVQANPARRFINEDDFIDAHLDSEDNPLGHGFDTENPSRTWYSVSPVPGVRLIALNSATPLLVESGLVYSEGAISLPQLLFLEAELREAQDLGEWVIVATHHPSTALEPAYGTSMTTPSLISLLNRYTCVKLHLAGHYHRNIVTDRGGYIEIVTGSLRDAQQEGRVIEIWDDGVELEMRYWMFSHLEEIEPPDETYADLFDDPLMEMRRVAADLAALTD